MIFGDFGENFMFFNFFGGRYFYVGGNNQATFGKNDAKFKMAFGERLSPNLSPKNSPNLYENTVIYDNLRIFFRTQKIPENALNTGFSGIPTLFLIFVYLFIILATSSAKLSSFFSTPSPLSKHT